MMKKKTMPVDAMSEVAKMMATPMNQLPAIANDYLKDLSKMVGFCGEVCVTAYAAYCQAVLKMPCENPLYKIEDDAKEWFATRGYKTEEVC
jgi:hypothetical protein